MPSKGKGHKLEVEGGAKTSASTSSKGGASSSSKGQQQKQEEDKLDLDEIARACLEIEQQMARQENRPKNRKKKAARLKNEVGGKEQKKGEGGEGVQQLSELTMTGETKGEATRLTELIKISVEVSSKEN